MNRLKTFSNRWVRVAAVVPMLLVVLVPSLSGLASARGTVPVSYNWVDASTIKADNWPTGSGTTTIYFKGSGAGGTTLSYTSDYSISGCTGNTLLLQGGDTKNATLTEFSYTAPSRAQPNGNCQTGQNGGSVSLGSQQNAAKTAAAPVAGTYGGAGFAWQDSSTIAVTGTITDSFVKKDRKYVRQNDPNTACPDIITVDANSTAKASLLSNQSGARGSCTGGTSHAISLTNTGSGPASAAAANTADPGLHDPNATCRAGDFGLNFILCPVFNGVANFCDFLFSKIVEPLLRTAPISTNPTDKSYQIWSQFRIYGNIFLVFALLIIVFGQSIGGGLVDAYTAKKVLPRLLAATILINLSIYIVAFMVDITNIIGGGLGHLLTAPLEGAGAFNITPSGIGAGEIIGGSTIAVGIAFAVGALVIPSASFIMLFLVLPVILGLLSAFITLILRKAILLALVLVSPVAFALYCLPNTEKYFKKWWDLLLSTLLVYPIVVGIFAIADILSVTVVSANNDANGLALLISFILQFLPLVFIPAAFKIAGGAIGKVAGLVSGASAKMNGMTKASKERAAFRYKQQRAGNASKINAGINKRLEKTSLGQRVASSKFQNTRTQRLGQRNSFLAAEAAKTAGGQAIQHNDPALEAATYDSYKEAVTGLTADRTLSDGTKVKGMDLASAQKAAAAVAASTGFGRSQAIYATEQMAKTGTAFKDIEHVARTISRASGGDEGTIAALAGNVNSTTKQVGRHDLAPGYTALNTLARGEAGLETTRPDAKNYSDAKAEAWKSGSLYQHANDKPQNIEAAVSHHESVLKSGIEEHSQASHAASIATTRVEEDAAAEQLKGAESKIEQAAVFFNELKVLSPNATGAVKDKVDEAIERNSSTLEAAKLTLSASDANPGTDKRQPDAISERMEPDGIDPTTGAPIYKKVVTSTPRPVRQENSKERIDRLSRTYERPDPNHS